MFTVRCCVSEVTRATFSHTRTGQWSHGTTGARTCRARAWTPGAAAGLKTPLPASCVRLLAGRVRSGHWAGDRNRLASHLEWQCPPPRGQFGTICREVGAQQPSISGPPGLEAAVGTGWRAPRPTVSSAVLPGRRPRTAAPESGSTRSASAVLPDHGAGGTCSACVFGVPRLRCTGLRCQAPASRHGWPRVTGQFFQLTSG